MAWHFDFKKMMLSVLAAFLIVAILNYLVSTYFGIPVLKLGVPLILILLGTYIAMILVMAADGKLDKGEIITLIVLAVLEIAVVFIFKHFVPGAFSAVPEPYKQIFSAIGLW